MFEFKAVQPEEICPAVERAFHVMEEDLHSPLRLEDGVVNHIAAACGGDVRKAMNAVELCGPVLPGTGAMCGL